MNNNVCTVFTVHVGSVLPFFEDHLKFNHVEIQDEWIQSLKNPHISFDYCLCVGAELLFSLEGLKFKMSGSKVSKILIYLLNIVCAQGRRGFPPKIKNKLN
jgi:hypothetical protein